MSADQVKRKDHGTQSVPGEGAPVDSDELCPATLQFCKSGHDGPGWYYWCSEYPEEGSCGAFETREEAVRHLTEADMFVEESS